MSVRVEVKLGIEDANLLEQQCRVLGMDRSHVIRLAIRRFGVAMKDNGWPIELPGVNPKK